MIYNAIVGWPFSLLCIHIKHPLIGVHIFFHNVHLTENWSKFWVNGLNIMLIEVKALRGCLDERSILMSFLRGLENKTKKM